MPDRREKIRPKLASLRLPPTREAEIVEELAQHLDDRYAELLSGGATAESAFQAALALCRFEDLEMPVADVAFGTRRLRNYAVFQ